ncbi:gamma-glutamyltranspeptidase [Paraburkholderia atlantica]|uniref:Glutathione hydrolase proenzyme n=1 Tax=Paraburkholderia atlantica TaxID=2654982 RepID=A0A7W8Q9D5_PARAM|nr:gamma-glutamyltransferase [Paraburkholderia atlantica]MBB5425511.1 gamma-glutamyltranspeptidase/glutathione hydrolase [Paraburkholderia atlantica]NUY32626.1 gamma-glutamyltransferase [Paraburkholderia atlantica]
MSHPNGPRTGRPPTRAPHGMVATPHYLASQAGVEMLQRGGTAVDAAIAANAVLCVAYPHMAGLGGDGFWLIAEGNSEQIHAINASGPAAQGATLAHYRGIATDNEIAARGPQAVLTVPGAIDGWRLAHERFGRLAWAELFAAAIGYARDGVPVSRSLADWTAQDVPILTRYPDTAAIFMPGGRVPADGEKLVQTALSRSLQQLADQGPRAGFYEGDLATRICAGVGAAGSPLQPVDFAAYRAEWVTPISTTYRGHTVYELPPNTQGFTPLQILNLIEGYDVTAWGDGTADYYHHLAEAVKIAFADREEWLTDPRFVTIPVDQLITKAYCDERRKLLDPERALDIATVPPGIAYQYPHDRRAPDGDTCYFCAADNDGMVVSLIQSIYHDFGSGVLGGDTGIIMQNRGAFFSLDEHHPNCLQPGKRTFHTLIPALMTRDGRPCLAFGSMGGEGQPQTQAALVTRIVDFGYDVQQAIEAPRWLMGRTWGTKSRNMSLEGRISDEVVRELKRRGQPVQMVTDWNDNMGHAHAIAFDRQQGFYEGGADPRGDGAALGY